MRRVNLLQDTKGNYSARKRLPEDVREEYGRLYGARFEAKFSVPGRLGRAAAEAKFREWDAEVARRIDHIRKHQRGEGIDLDFKAATALAGEWYSWFVAQYESAPGDPVGYETALWRLIDAMRQFAPEAIREQPLQDMEWSREPEVREGIRPVIADRGQTAQFLASRGIVLGSNARALFLDCALDNYLAALVPCKRRLHAGRIAEVVSAVRTRDHRCE